jgi:hypothetical protein
MPQLHDAPMILPKVVRRPKKGAKRSVPPKAKAKTKTSAK